MIKICITNLGKYNEGSLVYEWVTLPVAEDELEEVFARIGINEQYEEFFITDYECDFMRIDEYSSIEDLNTLAEDLDRLDTGEIETLKAIMEWGYHGEDLQTSIDNIDNFQLYSDINSEDELGNYWLFESGCYEVPENLAFYINTEKWGRDYSINAEGMFTKYGWVEYIG